MASPKPIAPTWQLHDAKARFSELFRRVRAEGPQRVVKHGGEAVVIVPAEEFDRIRERVGQPASLAEFFRLAPTGGKPPAPGSPRGSARCVGRSARRR
jgi:prevent-host-death family protein